MKTAIIYSSIHHKNTEKIVQTIAQRIPDVTLIDTTKVVMKDLQNFDLIGIASGIYFGNFHKSVLKFASDNLPEHKNIFFLYSCGSPRSNYTNKIQKIVDEKKCAVLGTYFCLGFDTFGPLKIIGGTQKGHPDEKEISDAVDFVFKLTNQLEK